MSLLDPRTEPVVHPEDRETPDEDGPWLAVLALAALAWVPLALADWRLLTEGTLLWATVRSLATLVLAPLAVAALLQDTRALAADGLDVGRVRWLYAGCTLVAPPAATVYLGHRRLLRPDDASEPVEAAAAHGGGQSRPDDE